MKKSPRTIQKKETIQKTKRKMKQKERKVTEKTKLETIARGERTQEGWPVRRKNMMIRNPRLNLPM